MKSLLTLLCVAGTLSLGDAQGVSALAFGFYQDSNCAGTPVFIPTTPGFGSAIILGECTFRFFEQGGAVVRSERRIFNAAQDQFEISQFSSTDCSGPVANTDTQDTNCVAEGSLFRKRIVATLQPGEYSRIALWDQGATGASPSTCFPEIKTVIAGQPSPATSSDAIEVAVLQGSCLQFATDTFGSILFSTSSGAFADATSFQSTNCTGVGTRLTTGCFNSLPPANSTLFVGDVNDPSGSGSAASAVWANTWLCIVAIVFTLLTIH